MGMCGWADEAVCFGKLRALDTESTMTTRAGCTETSVGIVKGKVDGSESKGSGLRDTMNT